MSLDTGLLVEMTDIRAAAPGARPGRRGRWRSRRQGRNAAAAATTGEQRGTDSQEYLKKEQKELLEAVRERAALREERGQEAREGRIRASRLRCRRGSR